MSRTFVSLLAGGLLAMALLVAWSCKTTRTGFLPALQAGDALEISSVEGVGSRPEPMIRVRIANRTSQIELAGRGPWLVAVAGARSGEVLNGPVTVQASNGGIRLTDRGGRVRGFGPDTVVYAGPVVRPGEMPGQEIVAVGRTRYPGTLRLHPRPDVSETEFDVVNVVELERYIPGVISKELLPHWDETAFMAQAVAARTFALSRRETARATGRRYDVDDTNYDQVYGGLTGLRVAIHAAEATRGVVLTDSGRLAGAYYSSTCGGKPALAEEVWPTNTPTIRNVAYSAGTQAQANKGREILCESAPLYEWDVARRTGELSDRIRGWAKKNSHDARKLGTLESIEVAERSSSGRSIAFELTDTSGKKAIMTAERFRAACNSSHRGMNDVSALATLHSGDVTVYVGKRATRFKGNGFGHGVGLCQYCAQAMAARGDNWRTLIEAFYPDAQLIRIY